MASITLRHTDKFPVGQSVSIYLRSQKVPGAAPTGSAVAGAFTVAADSTLTATGLLDGTDYTAYASVSSVPTYVDFRTEPPRLSQNGRASWLNEPLEDERRRTWLPGGAIAETFARSDVVSGAVALTSGTLLLAGGIVLPKGKTITRIGFISGTTAAGTPTNQFFCIVRQSDLAVLVKTADDTSTAWAANTAKELVLSAPYTPVEDTPVYIGISVAATTAPSLAGVALNNAAIAGYLTSNPVCGTSSTGLTNPASLGTTAGAITATVNWAYATVR